MESPETWHILEERLNSFTGKPPLVIPGDIWWASLGINVGSEINGKNENFSRPILILKVTKPGFYFGVPLSTRNKTGEEYISLKSGEKDAVACLHQAQAIDFRRLWTRISTLTENEFIRIHTAFLEYYSYNVFPALTGGVATNVDSGL